VEGNRDGDGREGVGRGEEEGREEKRQGPPKNSCLRASWNEVTALSTADSGTSDTHYRAQSSGPH
jgi:hypothetical protein